MVTVHRETKETKIECEIDLNGCGNYKINTKIGFFDHMLEALSKHSGIDIRLNCDGDTHIDFHHSVEDCGIVLGKALKEAIFPIDQVERYANAIVVMDEAAVECAIDLSNRPFLVYDIDVFGKVGDFDVELANEFFAALCANGGFTCHIVMKRGKNKHHILEACFKSFAVSLRRALMKNEKLGVPSTKGIL